MPPTQRRANLSSALAGVVVASFVGAFGLQWSVSWADAAEVVWQLSFVAYGVLGALLVRRRPALALGWLLLVAGLLVEVAAFVDAYAIRAATEGWPADVASRWLQSLLWLPALSIVLVHVPLRFPNGLLRGSRWRWVSVAAIGVVGVATVATAFAPGPIGVDLPVDNPLGIEAVGGILNGLSGCGALLLPLGVASFVALFRRRRASFREHLQHRWFGFSLLLGCAVAAASTAFSGVTGFAEVVAPLLVAVAIAAPAVGITIAVLRHRLYGIDAIISRSATYVILSAGAALLAVATVVAVSATVGRSTTGGTVITAIVVAFFVRASWQWVQRRVDRAVYGERGDPLRAIRTLSMRLELAGSIDDALDVAASTLATTLLLPMVAISLRGASDTPVGPPIVVGATDGPTVSFPITTQATTVAELVVGVRRGETRLDPADVELIGELARSLGPLCQASALEAELSRSLVRLGDARDDERERIHRDLHDGLGPTLAGLALRTDILRSRAGPEGAVELTALEYELNEAFRAVTKMIDGLRPKLLDDRGLAAGLQDHCAALTATTSPRLDFHLSTDGDLSKVGPAVESAAWYIASEALANVIRHSRARSCGVHLSCTDHLEIVVADDGCGVDDVDPITSRRTGVRSMTLRAGSVGGCCTFTANQVGGTTVRAVLPLEST